MPILNSEVITLRRRRTRDADALVTLWCQTGGKIVASTRSVLKTSSRYAGVTQPFNRLYAILYAKTEDRDIWTLTQASLIESYEGIQNDLNRMSFAANLVEWIDALSGEFQSSGRVWRMLTELLPRWNRQPPAEEELLYYQLHLLIDAGLQPHIGHCQTCQRTQSDNWRYIAEAGCLFCESCGREGIRLSGGSVEILRRFSERSQPPFAIHLSARQKEEIRQLLLAHGAYHAGLQPRAQLVQEQIQKNRLSRFNRETVDVEEGSSR